MRTYVPDKWVLLKMTHPTAGVSYKVLASWYGGFGGGDSWKLSSGTSKVERNDEYNSMQLHQVSGSVYDVHKSNRGLSGYTSGVLNTWMEALAKTPELGTIEVMDENFDLASIPKL